VASDPRRLGLLALLLLAGCQLSTEGGAVPGGGGATIPTATPAGQPQGEPVAATIGEAGGALSVAGGALRLVVPAGGVAGPTTFTARPSASNSTSVSNRSTKCARSAPPDANR